MSVVVYRDGVLACDLQLTDNEVATGQRFMKIMKRDGALFGAVGGASEVEEYFNWARSKLFKSHLSLLPDAPSFSHAEEGEREYTSDMYWITKDGKVLQSSTDTFPIFFQSDAEYAAIGSGKFIAMGALAAGATAEEAVLAACKHDTYCGVGVASVSLNGTKSADPVVRLFEPMRLKDEPEA